MYVCASVHICMHLFIHVIFFIHVCMYVCTYVCVYLCMYVCMCMNMCIYIYIYIYISATVPSGRWACIHRVFWASILLDWNPFRGPSTHGSQRSDSVAWPFSPPCAHLAPHVGHLARLVGHLGANMFHKCSQDARKMPSWSQHRQKSASATSSSTPKYQKTCVFYRFL